MNELKNNAESHLRNLQEEISSLKIEAKLAKSENEAITRENEICKQSVRDMMTKVALNYLFYYCVCNNISSSMLGGVPIGS